MDKLYIKNMVCNRCIMAVEQVLKGLSVQPESVSLGEVILGKKLSTEQKKQFDSRLTELGFELIDDRKSQLIERIKGVIIELVHYRDNNSKMNLSSILSEKLKLDYNYLSNLFSDVEGITIEKYFIAQKIEKVKELLVYDELSLSEIAYQLNYSSVAYLSNQFKKVTGLTPSRFKKIGENKRKPLDKV